MKNLWILKQKNHNFFLIAVYFILQNFFLALFFLIISIKNFLIAVFFIKKVSKNKTNPLFEPDLHFIPNFLLP